MSLEHTEPGPDRPGGTASNLADLVAGQARIRPDGVALIQPQTSQYGSGRRQLTWQEFDSQVNAVAAGLAAHGLIAGHRVGIIGANSIEFVIAYFAALRAGFVAVPMNPQSSPDEFRTMIGDSGTRVVVADVDPTIDGVDWIELTEDGLREVAAAGRGPIVSPPDPEALAVLLYTAGTSGDPKAAMLSHRALIAHLDHLDRLGVVDAEVVTLVLLPLFHVFGLNAVLGGAIRAGGAAVIVDGFPRDLFKIISEEGVSQLTVAPSAIFRFLQHDQLEFALKGVATVISGAAPLPQALAESFEQRTHLRVEQGYGLTEAAPGVTATLGGELLGPGHVGRALPGVEVRIGNEGDDPGEPAEIWVRGDNLFSGYWPDGHDGVDQDGWFATGDIGYLDGGELFLVDRARELIIVSGFNVYPAEVEEVIREVAGVELVAVVGSSEDRVGELVIAFVVGSATEEEIRQHCSVRLARFKQPAEIHRVEALPRGATGKIKKGALRRLLATPEEGRLS